MRFGSCTLLLVLCAPPAAAHSRWDLDGPTPPRDDSTGLKRTSAQKDVDSCGGAPRTSTPSQFKPGDRLEVRFVETINHEGHFEIDFSAGDDRNFAQYRLAPNIPDTYDDAKLVITHTITFPNIKCDRCTLRLTQIMDDSETIYVSCADIQLVDNPQPRPRSTGTPSNLPPPGKVQGLKVKRTK